MGHCLDEVKTLIIYLILSSLMFYSGAMTGVVYESRRMENIQKRLFKLESMQGELLGKVQAHESILRKK